MKRGRSIRALAALALIVPLAACSGLNTQQQRTLSGGALGAAGGAALGWLAGGSMAAGALIGGAAGAAVGAFTHDDQVKVNP